MAFQPLTPEQYKKATDAGFSFDQIVGFEKQRKQEADVATISVPPAFSIGTPNAQSPQEGKGFLVGEAKGVASTLDSANPLATMNKMAGATKDWTGQPFAAKQIALAPTSPAQNQGFGAERIAEAVVPALSPAKIKAGGTAVQGIGRTMAQMFIPKSTEESAALRVYKASSGNSLLERMGSFLTDTSKAPATAASTAFDKGLIGTESSMGVKATKVKAKLWSSIVGPALKQSDTRVQMGDFFSQAEQKITQENPDPTRRGVLMNALSSIKEDFGAVKNISMEQLQKYKEGWAKWVPEKAYKGADISAAINDVRNTLSFQAREAIYQNLGGNVKQAYMDYSNLYAIEALADKAGAGGIVKSGGTFTGLKGLFELATVPMGTIAGQTIYKVGQGLDMIGAPGARTIYDLLTGKNASSTSPPTLQQPQPPTPPPTQ